MVYKKVCSLSFLLLLFSILPVKAEDSLRLRVFDEPAGKEWWQRSEFLAAGSVIREIPAHQIDSTWHYASEFVKNAIPSELLYNNGKDIMDEAGITFSRYGDFNSDGAEDLALVGIYEDCNLQAGSFFLILTRNKSGKWHVSFLKLLGEPKFAAISAKGAVEVKFCIKCEGGARLQWNSQTREYTLKTE